MLVQFNTDESVEGREALARHASEVVEHTLGRFSDHVTRVEIHVSDVNGERGGLDDKRCLMEARIGGRQPVAVSEEAGSVHQAIEGATQKLKRTLDSILGKLADKKRRAAAPALAPAEPAEPEID